MASVGGGVAQDNWDGLKVNNVPVYTVIDYRYALFSIPIAMFVALILMVFMKETHAQVKG